MNLGKYKGIKLIGSGAYGKIFKGVSVANGENVAIKMISLHERGSDYPIEIQQEIEFMKNLSDTSYPESIYVVKYLDDYDMKIGSTLYKIIVMEDLSDWITLDNHMKELYRLDKCGKIAADGLKTIVINLLRGLTYIHSRGIAHRDIKPENIMMDKSYNIKYIDFGLSCSLNCTGYKGTPLYLPPETAIFPNDKVNLPPNLSGDMLINHNFKIVMKHDIWSLGLVIYQLCNLARYPNNFPFDIGSNITVYNFLSSMRAAPYKYPSKYSYDYGYLGLDFNQLIVLMLTVDPELRPDTNSLLLYIEQFITL
jgi:serine/threonine protein kinase